MPHSHRITENFLEESYLIVGRQLVDVLIVVNQDVSLREMTGEEQEGRVNGEHQSGKEQQTTKFYSCAKK